MARILERMGVKSRLAKSARQTQKIATESFFRISSLWRDSEEEVLP